MKNIILTLTLLLSFTHSLYAQKAERNVQSGDFVVEQAGKKKDSYADQQDAVLKYFDDLSKAVASLKDGKSVSAPASPKEPFFYRYMNAVYLDCAIKRGSCPIFLDSLLEADLINAKKEGKASCPNLRRFWKSWIQNDMEKRHGHKVKTGLINKTKKFKKEQRPKYIKCDATIEKMLAENDKKGVSDFFKVRYKDKPQTPKSVLTTKKYLDQIKDKNAKDNTNVFYRVGM